LPPPPPSTLFPTRRSSDLSPHSATCWSPSHHPNLRSSRDLSLSLPPTYETSLNYGDAGRIEQLYAEDGVFMPAGFPTASGGSARSEDHTSELQSPYDLVCR